MAMTDNIKDIIEQQKKVLLDLEALEKSNLAAENKALEAELSNVKASGLLAQETIKKTREENAQLKNALYEQVYSQRQRAVEVSKEKLEIYFKSSVEGEQNRLSAMTEDIKKRIDAMTAALNRNHVDIHDEIYGKLNELSSQLDSKITLATAEFNKINGAFSENERIEFENLKQEQITNEMIKENARKNNWESFVGLNLINKLGIFLIIIGVIAASQYAYLRLPDMLRGILMFGLGGLMLIGGELLNSKKPNVFSLGITSGGVAILYVALGVSYFGLSILGTYPALFLCLLITAVSLVLTLRYHAQIILIFSLIGGYLPIFAIGTSHAMLYGAMLYFVVLNVLALLVASKRRWAISPYIGLFLNIIGTLFIVFASDGANNFIVILYILFVFFVYTCIPVMSAYTQKQVFKKSDIILMGINTFFSSLFMYFVFWIYDYGDFYGLLAIVFAVIYLALGKFIERKIPNDKSTSALFYLTGFTFVVLMVPFQFGYSWLSLGWLAEGVALTAYAILAEEKRFKKIGFTISGLCLLAFLLFDVVNPYRFLFPYKYFAITLGSLVILGSYIRKNSLSSGWEKAFKYGTMINLWFYIIYVIVSPLRNLIHISSVDDMYLCNALAIAATFLLAYTMPRIRILCDKGIKGIAVGMDIIGILWLTILNTFCSPIPYGPEKVPILYTILGTMILIFISLLSVLALYDMMKCVVVERKVGIEFFPLVISGYFTLMLTQNLITQYNLSFTNFAISIIYVITALVWIIVGFVKRYALLRRFGLGFSIFAVIKLFLLDFINLAQGYQIVSYFALGVTLVIISLIYQYFNKRLELTVNVKENHD